MSTSQAGLFEWKQEVNRRLAEHRSRRVSPAAGPRAVSASHRDNGHNRGAEAAARVAQRFAHAPRYLDMLVDDARERRAQDTQSAAVVTEEHSGQMPARFEAKIQPAPEPPPAEEPHISAAEAITDIAAPISDWHAPEIRPEGRADARLFGGSAGELQEQPAAEWDAPVTIEEMQAADADWMHGNLIEFPRELVATRKIRPRLVEGPLASSRSAQLSIFEVEPGTVSTVAEPADAQPATDWNAPEWSGIKLEAQPVADTAQAAAPSAVPFPADSELAPWSRRLLALTVDAALICSAVLAAGAVFAANASSLPGPRAMGVVAALGIVTATLLYDLLFFSLAQATPGMRYACIGLWTFRNERPTREQRWRRLGAAVLSVLPVGLGLIWSIFDEDRLCWHDRLSQTYLKSSF